MTEVRKIIPPKDMRVKILGTQSPYNTAGHNSPGFLIVDGENKVMLDCGSGSHSLLNLPNDLIKLTVILTHLHRDHYNDIYNLQYASFVFHNQKRLETSIDVYLPATPNSVYNDIKDEINAYATYKTINEKSILCIGNMLVSFCKMNHPVETYAVKITNGKSTIVYSSDTSFSAKDDLARFAQNADLLICEASLLKEHGFPEINTHLTAEQAGIIAREANVKKLLLTHFWPEEVVNNYVREAKNIFPEVIAAKEGDTINI